MPTALRRRIERLERRFMVEIRQPSVAHRLIVRGMVEPLNLENSTYQQVPWGADAVVECILLEGCPDDSTQAELDAWIARQAAGVQLESDTRIGRTI